MMENAEEILQVLEDFSKRKPKLIPQELNDYLTYVARTGDPVYQWTLVKSLFKEKLLNVITDFYETTPGIDIPPYPNVDPFNYDTMKNGLLERMDSFTSAPFTVQRICELLTTPRKQYNRVDKFMRAIEKNILVVSTTEPGIQRHIDQENGESHEPIVNGSDNNSDYNVDVEMEDMSWKDNAALRREEPQPSSSDAHITVDDIEGRLNVKDDTLDDNGNKTSTEYESVTPPEPSLTTDEQMLENKPSEEVPQSEAPTEAPSQLPASETEETKPNTETKPESNEPLPTLVIPEIRVDDAEMTEQKLSQQALSAATPEVTETPASIPDVKPTIQLEEKPVDSQDISSDENSSEMIMQDNPERKVISEISTSSEESSSSDNTDGNSNSPKTDTEPHIDAQEDSSQDTKSDTENTTPESVITEKTEAKIESENYSISDVKSELQIPEKSATPEVNVDDIPPEGSKPAEPTPGEPIIEKTEDDTKVEPTETKIETELVKTD